MHLRLEYDVIYIPDFRAFGEYTRLTSFSFDYDYETGIEAIFDLEKLREYNPNGSMNEITIKGASDKNF